MGYYQFFPGSSILLRTQFSVDRTKTHSSICCALLLLPMPFVFNNLPPLDGAYKWLDSLSSNRNTPGSLVDSNTSCHDFIADSCFSTTSMFQNGLAIFSLEPCLGSIYPTDNFFSFNPCLPSSTLQSLRPDFSARNIPSCYYIPPLNAPKTNCSLGQTSRVHGFPHPDSFCSSDLVPKTLSNINQCVPMSRVFHSSSQYPSNLAIVYDIKYVYVGANHVFAESLNQQWPDINQRSSLVRDETFDVLQTEGNFSYNSLDDNLIYIDALWHRFYQANISAAPTDHFSDQNEEKADVLQTLNSQIFVKRKAPEEDEGEEQSLKRNSHQCKLCNISSRTGNALGGHTSYHAKNWQEEEISRRKTLPKGLSNCVILK